MVTLTVVSPAPASPHRGTVLSASLVERLAVLNAAARELRAMGYRIVEELPRMDRDRAEIRIERTARSIAGLLDRGRNHAWKTGANDQKIGYTVFRDVIVSWGEPCAS
ncbi:hypothetical protein ACT2FY_42855 [Paraburkholderia fungorum]|uniref:hypothetical protein n=1 Tax=Paraburkholderia fungorum TaxID=134537 RepID=UPI00402B6143